MLENLPWQELVTGLIVLIALGQLTRRWWPGKPAKAACHDTGGPAATSGGCGSGCANCSSHAGTRIAQPRESEIRIHRSKPQ